MNFARFRKVGWARLQQRLPSAAQLCGQVLMCIAVPETRIRTRGRAASSRKPTGRTESQGAVPALDGRPEFVRNVG
jgi:hypothetical protein